MPLDLDAIERRAQAAACGSWTCEDESAEPERFDPTVCGDDVRITVERPGGNDYADATTWATAFFVAAARTDVPALLALCRAERRYRVALATIATLAYEGRTSGPVADAAAREGLTAREALIAAGGEP